MDQSTGEGTLTRASSKQSSVVTAGFVYGSSAGCKRCSHIAKYGDADVPLIGYSSGRVRAVPPMPPKRTHCPTCATYMDMQSLVQGMPTHSWHTDAHRTNSRPSPSDDEDSPMQDLDLPSSVVMGIPIRDHAVDYIAHSVHVDPLPPPRHHNELSWRAAPQPGITSDSDSRLNVSHDLARNPNMPQPHFPLPGYNIRYSIDRSGLSVSPRDSSRVPTFIQDSDSAFTSPKRAVASPTRAQAVDVVRFSQQQTLYHHEETSSGVLLRSLPRVLQSLPQHQQYDGMTSPGILRT
jgi:hypothetical protein